MEIFYGTKKNRFTTGDGASGNDIPRERKGEFEPQVIKLLLTSHLLPA